ncbi:MAG: hypothetical protein P4L69_20355 [Desulfosporosinus sp.]|nr:hypothetical protein [Desulfosporosinus sp.]
MKKFSKKIMAIVGTATLAVGLMALPALAGTTQQQGNNWFSQMQAFMQNSFLPKQHQELMNSQAMQNLHNSTAMQESNITAMPNLMNSDPAVKAQLGKDNLAKMNPIMSNAGSKVMSKGSVTGSGSTMMNGNGVSSRGSNMMGTSGTMLY